MLLKKGDEPAVAFGRKQGLNEIRSYKIGDISSTLFHVLMTRVFDMHGLFSKKATRGLLDYIDDFKPDIVHLHNLHGYYLNLKLLFEYIAKKQIKVVWTLHDCWALTGHCSHFEYVQCDKWQNECYKCPQKSEYPKCFLFDISKKNYIFKKVLFTLPKDMIIITPSEWLKKIVKKSYLSKYEVKTINTGIDLKMFKKTDSDFKTVLGLKDKKVVLGVASPFTYKKGLNDFIKLSTLIDKRYKIVLAGLSEKQINKLPKNILGLKRMENAKEMAKLYSMSDIFLNPTKEDTFPTTILEALACGTPVITYDVGGCSEAVDNECGLLVKSNNIDGLLDAIKKVEKNSLSESDCINKAKDYNKEKQVLKTYDVYNLV